jgi:DNA-binding CsgD family transcriptional regulator
MSSRSWLTPAEHTAAVRAAAGASNRQIAQELSLSVRTVENRLLQVYRKLGVGGRSDLPEALRSLSGPGRAAGDPRPGAPR